jgi:hypothetical protein
MKKTRAVLSYCILKFEPIKQRPHRWLHRTAGEHLFLTVAMEQRINPSEELGFSGNSGYGATGYFPSVQARDNQDLPVVGSLAVNLSCQDPLLHFSPTATTARYQGIDGIAVVNEVRYLGTAPPTGMREVRLIASATIGTDAVTTQIPIFIHSDGELSGGGQSFHHQLYPLSQNEIIGDNISDANEPSPATNQKKDVFVELDYFTGFSRANSIAEIIEAVESIWRMHGVELHIVTGSEIPSSNVPSEVTRQQAKGLLKDYRDVTKRSYIHIVIGKGASTSWLSNTGVLGINVVMRDAAGDGYSFWDCANLGSGDPAWRAGSSRWAYLDSMGVYMFANRIDNLFTFPPLGWTWTNVYAWLIAHELGHALGRHDHDNGSANLMMENALAAFSFGWSNSIELRQASYDMINTRIKLGVETVDINY